MPDRLREVGPERDAARPPEVAVAATEPTSVPPESRSELPQPDSARLTASAPGFTSDQRVDSVLSLQRSHGNAFVQQWLRGRELRALLPGPGVEGPAARALRPDATAPLSVQREGWTNPLITFKSDAELIKDGLGGDITAIRKIGNYGAVPEDQRLKMIDLLVGQGKNMDWRDRSALVDIWGSFADLDAAVAGGPDRWERSVKSGANLGSIQRVKEIKEQFPEVIRGTAQAYLSSNRTTVRQEQIAYGLPVLSEDKLAPLNEDQTQKLMQMQSAAETVAQNQQAQEAARRTFVGYDKFAQDKAAEGGDVLVTKSNFNPYQAPDYDTDPNNIGPKPQTSWQAMDDKWKKSIEKTQKLVKEFPALYAVSREGSSALTTKFATQQSPEQMRAFLGKAMEQLITDIGGAEKKLKDGVLDPLDLTPVAHGLLDGTRKPENTRFATDWSKPLASFAGRDMLKDHQLNNALEALGYQLAAEALFILAPFTGGASLFVMLAGVGVLGAKANESAQTYEAMAQAAKTSVDPKKDIVSDEQVSIAQMQMEADQAAVALAVLTAAGAAAIGAIGAAVRGARMMRLRALVADAEALEKLRALAKNDAALERLLRRVNDPAKVEALLRRAGSAEAAEELLAAEAAAGAGAGVEQASARAKATPEQLRAMRASGEEYYVHRTTDQNVAANGTVKHTGTNTTAGAHPGLGTEHAPQGVYLGKGLGGHSYGGNYVAIKASDFPGMIKPTADASEFVLMGEIPPGKGVWYTSAEYRAAFGK